MPDTVIFDVDGTLVDSNYQHTLAWYRALRRSSITVPIWRIHRTIGMGGDKLITELAGRAAEKTHGDEVRTSWEEEFESLMGEIQPLPGAHELVVEVKRRGFRIVLASSGKAAHVEHSMDLIGGRELADAWTTSDDVSDSKPAPDLVNTALQKVSRSEGIMIGDSTWDVIAAENVNVPTIACSPVARRAMSSTRPARLPCSTHRKTCSITWTSLPWSTPLPKPDGKRRTEVRPATTASVQSHPPQRSPF